MSLIDDFINALSGSQDSNALTTVNDSERDGNVNDLLLRFDQSALTVGGGTTLTSISPTTALNDLGSGKISLAVLVWIAILGFTGWWLLKNR
jgi:hypothetical protein